MLHSSIFNRTYTIFPLKGCAENAVRIQISSAIIAYYLVAIVQHDLTVVINRQCG